MYVTSRGSKVYYESHGDSEAPTLLCIGGWGLTTGEHFNLLPQRLRDRYHVVVYDHRGLGYSDPDEGPPSTASYALDAGSVLKGLNKEAVLVLGQGGLGAGVAQHLAFQSPELVKRMVLASGWAGPEVYHDRQLEGLYSLRKEAGFDAFAELCSTLVYTPEHLATNPDAFPASWRGLRNIAHSEAAHLRLIRANLRHDARARLGYIQTPTLVVAGEFDLLGGPRLARELAELLPNSELAILEGVPHAFSSVEGGARRYEDQILEFFGRAPTNAL